MSNASELLHNSPFYKCEVCKTTGKRIAEIAEEKTKKMKQLNVGFFIDMNPSCSMLFCKKCNIFLCTDCVKEMSCPRCQTFLGMDSFVETADDPLAMLTLVQQKAKK